MANRETTITVKCADMPEVKRHIAQLEARIASYRESIERAHAERTKLHTDMVLEAADLDAEAAAVLAGGKR